MAHVDLAKYQSDHLILLVGGNPLPNAVAAQLLAASDATIWLLHSGGDSGNDVGTKSVAENLEMYLQGKNKKWTIHLEPIPSAENVGIKSRMREIIGKDEMNGRIGLHYTGGTKSMSIHTYRELEQLLGNNQPRPIFSYLDPNKLALRIDGYGTEPSRFFPILKTDNLRHSINISHLDQLAALHNYEPAINSNDEKWGESEDILALAKAMVQTYITPQGREQWKRLWLQWRRTPKDQDFDLPDRDNYSALSPVVAALDKLCGVSATANKVAKALLPHKENPTLRSCSKWFLGVWLELYAAFSFAQLPDNLHISYHGTNLFYRNRTHGSDHFELDMAGIIGYQLFAVSCIATPNKSQAKEHFLEIYVRARQLGGDEARIGLICLVEDQKRLEEEIKSLWDAEGKVKVFGIDNLTNLTTHLTDWLHKQSNL